MATHTNPPSNITQLLAKEPKDYTEEEAELLKVIAMHKEVLQPYLDERLLIMVDQQEPRWDDPTLKENYSAHIAKGIISLTHMAAAWNRTTASLSKEFKQKGFKIKYDRNRRYYKGKIITYVEVPK